MDEASLCDRCKNHTVMALTRAPRKIVINAIAVRSSSMRRLFMPVPDIVPMCQEVCNVTQSLSVRILRAAPLRRRRLAIGYTRQRKMPGAIADTRSGACLTPVSLFDGNRSTVCRRIVFPGPRANARRRSMQRQRITGRSRTAAE